MGAVHRLHVEVEAHPSWVPAVKLLSAAMQGHFPESHQHFVGTYWGQVGRPLPPPCTPRRASRCPC